MISVSSTTPEFGINFRTPIPVSEIALAKLSVYHSWPNVRSASFGGLQPNNSFVFGKSKADSGEQGELDWNTITLPTGSYQIEEINNEIQRQIKRITGKEAKISITAHEPTLSAVIEISTPGYAVDIYNSSIRTLLGWPKAPEVKPRPPKPEKSDFMTYKEALHDLEYNYYLLLADQLLARKSTLMPDTWSIEAPRVKGGQELRVYRLDDIESELFIPINLVHKQQLQLLRVYFQDYISDLTSPRDNIITTIEKLNKLASAMETINLRIIQALLDLKDYIDDNYRQIARADFAIKYGIQVNDISDFKFPGYNVPELRKSVSDLIDQSFEDILAAYARTKPQPVILRHDNSTASDGRHISPGIVNITDVIAVNLVCDVIDGSYSASDTTTAQQGFILYTFTPRDPPGFLIVQEPINPVYLRCHNPWLSTINFKLTDQRGNLLDLRDETVSINLLVKS